MDEKKRPVYKKVEHNLSRANSFALYEDISTGPQEPPGDMHFDPQLVIVLKGSMEFEQGEKRVLCRSGQLCLSGPYQPHCARFFEGTTRYLGFTLDFYSLNSFTPFQDVNYLQIFLQDPADFCPVRNRRDRAFVLRIGRKLHWLELKKPAGYKTGQYLEIHRLLWFLHTRLGQSGHLPYRSILQISPALLLVQNSQDRLLPLDEAANACNLSRSRFSAVFREHMGISFNAFALRRRLNAAAGLLLTSPERSMKEIAQESGFSDVSHFYRAFKNVFHCTPLDFTRKHQS